MQLTCEQSLSKLLFKLIKERPFFGNVLLRLRDASESSAIETAAATSSYIIYNREFMDSLTEEEKNFVWLHEFYHIILFHPSRIAGRNQKLWNIAADFMVNFNLLDDESDLKAAGISIKSTDGALIADKDYVRARTTEQIYNELIDQFNSQGGDENLIGNYTFTIGGTSFSTDILNEDLVESTDISSSEFEELKDAIRNSISSWGEGKGGLIREIKKLVGNSLPWYRYVRRYLTSRQDDEDSFNSPYKGTLWMKRILPGPGSFDKEILTDIIIGIDTSASITEKMLTDYLYQVHSLVNDFELTGRVIFWDDGVEADYSVQDVLDGRRGKPKGGGGTVITPVIEYINKKYRNANLILFLTDGYFSEPKIKSRVPIIWTLNYCDSVESREILAKYGRVLYID